MILFSFFSFGVVASVVASVVSVVVVASVVVLVVQLVALVVEPLQFFVGNISMSFLS